jgi:hypothetical protein
MIFLQHPYSSSLIPFCFNRLVHQFLELLERLFTLSASLLRLLRQASFDLAVGLQNKIYFLLRSFKKTSSFMGLYA